MDLMVKINAVNMEVFQVSYPPPFSYPARTHTAVDRKPSRLSVHPNLLRLFSRGQPQLSLLALHTLSNSNSNSSSTRDTLPNTPVHPHIRTTRVRDTLLNRNLLWHHEPKCKPPWYCPHISRTYLKTKR